MKHIQGLIPPIISLTIFIVVALLMSTVPTLNFQVDAYFWTQIIGSTLAILLTFVVWCPTGEQKAKLEKKVITNGIIYNMRANYIVDKQYFKELRSFCDFKNEETKKDIIVDYLEAQQIEYSTFVLYNKKDKTDEEKAELEGLLAQFTDKQIALLNKLNTKGVKFEKLTPNHITTGRVHKHSVVNKNREHLFKYFMVAFKSIWGVFTTCFTYFVVIVPNETFGIAQVVMIFMWFFTFLMAIYQAIQTGYKSIAVFKDGYNQDQAELCAEFFAFIQLPQSELDALAVSITNSITAKVGKENEETK